MREFSRDGLVFDVDDSGPADGEVVVMLHGFPENRTAWHAMTPPLTAAGFRVLAPDQRGYSPRARPPARADYRMSELVADVLSLVEASGAPKVHLVGHDWGGAVAWAFAHRHPDKLHTLSALAMPHPLAFAQAMVRGTQLLHSWYMLVFQLPWLPESGYRDPGDQLTRRAFIRSGLPAEAVERYLAPMREPGAATAAINWYRAMPLTRQLPGRGRSDGSRREEAKVTVPTLHVHGTKDRFLTRKAADLTEKFVAAPYRYEVLDGVSHWIPEVVPDAAAAMVAEHARAHSPR